MNFGSKISARKPNYSLSFTFCFFKSLARWQRNGIFSRQNGTKTKCSWGYANRRLIGTLTENVVVSVVNISSKPLPSSKICPIWVNYVWTCTPIANDFNHIL